jgi:hypothetical protein
MTTTNRERRVQFELRPAVYVALVRELQKRGESIEDRGAIGRFINDVLQQLYCPVVNVLPAPPTAPAVQADDGDGFGFDRTQL